METVLIVSSVLLWLIVLCNILLTLALIRRVNANNANQQVPDVGGLAQESEAPDFHAEMLTGQQVDLATYTHSEQSTLLLFISTHCDPCHKVLTMLKELGPGAFPPGVRPVVVSGDEHEPSEALVEELQLPWPVLIAPRATNSFFTDYNISATPSYCLFDAEGKVQSSGIASIQREAWKALIHSWTTRTPILSERR